MGSKTFDYNSGSFEKFVVPAGVKIINVTLRGAGNPGVRGGRVVGSMQVNGGDTFFVFVGRRGFAASGSSGGDPAPGGGGRGGDGKNGKAGGRGGCGATYIRKNARDGRIIAVAGGAGGGSGDGGAGGKGGAAVGQIGGDGNAGTGTTHHSTGGTQNQNGKGGTTDAGTVLWGRDGAYERLGRGGAGGTSTLTNTIGGGGGGGGYYPGGGGQGGITGTWPAGGGGGGSNFAGGLYSVTSVQGGGNDGDHGQVIFRWEDPGGNTPPSPPTGITIGGQPAADGMATKATHSITVSGIPDDPDKNQGVRMLVWVAPAHADGSAPTFSTHSTFKGTWDEQEKRDKVTLTGLSQDTHYYLRIYTEDHNGKRSLNYRSANFWTNRRPLPPNLSGPGDNAQFSVDLNTTFSWYHQDADPNDGQTAFEMRYRRAGTPVVPAGEWVTTGKKGGNFNSWVIDAGAFKGNTFYEWQVRTWDEQDRMGEWSDPWSFYTTADATPPLLIDPLNNTAIVAAYPKTFHWRFLTPSQAITQSRADIRYRVVGAADWSIIFGSESEPGLDWFYEVPGDTFAAGNRYEWQVRTYSSAAVVSDWSESGYFWATAAPGSGAGISLVDSGRSQDPLGVGQNRVFVFDRGGTRMLGELTPLVDVAWGRKRDDISSTTIHLAEWDESMRRFLGSLRSWVHELVVFRDGVRCWEGPITRISASKTQVEIEAKDVMAYVYRRIMRQGYNDSYRIINGTQIGQHTVVERASQIVMNALAYDDPNVLPYLTPLNNPGDAKTSRSVKDFVKTAWEEVDDLAATAGLDYTAIGRRIAFWDTHRPIGRLPEMRDGDFGDSPIVTEYGMSMANVFGVTNNNGLYGLATKGLDANGLPGSEGFIEQLASAYGESEGQGTEQTLTREAIKRAIESMTNQAERNISPRWPAPLVVRVPDNTSLNPELNLGINQLVPGVWIPLRSNSTIREVAQWQKLDSIQVTQDDQGEKITVVMSPAPNGGEDPDVDALAQEA